MAYVRTGAGFGYSWYDIANTNWLRWSSEYGGCADFQKAVSDVNNSRSVEGVRRGLSPLTIGQPLPADWNTPESGNGYQMYEELLFFARQAMALCDQAAPEYYGDVGKAIYYAVKKWNEGGGFHRDPTQEGIPAGALGRTVTVGWPGAATIEVRVPSLAEWEAKYDSVQAPRTPPPPEGEQTGPTTWTHEEGLPGSNGTEPTTDPGTNGGGATGGGGQTGGGGASGGAPPPTELPSKGTVITLTKDPALHQTTVTPPPEEPPEPPARVNLLPALAVGAIVAAAYAYRERDR